MRIISPFTIHQIAIESDGVRCHGIQQLEHDLERQSRYVWKFARIRASEFYYNRNEITNKLIEAIENY